MSGRLFRANMIAATFLFVAAIFVLGFIFWRSLPPVVPTPPSEHKSKPFAGVPELPSALPMPRLDEIRVAILDEPENVRVTAAGYYANDLRSWREFLTQLGARITDVDNADVLIAPEMRCLGPVHRRQIATHLARGRGVVSTGALGAATQTCTPLRDTLLTQLAGSSPGSIRKAPNKPGESYYAVLLGETILGANMPPGSRMEMSPVSQIVFHNPAREVFYSQYDRHRVNEKDNEFHDAAAVRALVGRGRLVAYGYSIQDFVDDWSKQIGRIAFSNGVRWASGKPFYQMAPWPKGFQAAAVLAQDVEADYHNATIAYDALDKYNPPGTAFIVGKLAVADPRTTARIKSEVEIATHTHNHYPLDTLSSDALLNELQLSKTEAERIAGKPVTGLRPPEERFTLETLQLWADLGGDYVFGSNNGRAAGPEILPLLPDSLILLGRVSEDDFEILSRDQIRDRHKMSQLLVHQVGEIVAYRGLYMFSYHSHMFSQKELVPVLRALADKLSRSKSVWTTSAGEVARWWRARSKVKIQPQADGTVIVENINEVPFSNGVMIIDGADGKRRRIQIPTLQAGDWIKLNGEGRLVEQSAKKRQGARTAGL